MSSQPPPSYTFSGINYNPSYFTSTKSSTGLTTATANTLYLRKTFPDTATSIETFSGGIVTNSIEPAATTSLTIGVTNASDITIGKALVTTTITGPLTSSGVLTANGGLTIGTNKNITLPLTITSPTAFTMIGGTSYNNITITTPIGGTMILSSVLIPNAGIYLITCQFQVTSSSSTFVTYYSNIVTSATLKTVNTNITVTTALIPFNWGQQTQGFVTGGTWITTGGTHILSATANTYYNFFGNLINTGTNSDGIGYFNITRIA